MWSSGPGSSALIHGEQTRRSMRERTRLSSPQDALAATGQETPASPTHWRGRPRATGTPNRHGVGTQASGCRGRSRTGPRGFAGRALLSWKAKAPAVMSRQPPGGRIQRFSFRPPPTRSQAPCPTCHSPGELLENNASPTDQSGGQDSRLTPSHSSFSKKHLLDQALTQSGLAGG